MMCEPVHRAAVDEQTGTRHSTLLVQSVVQMTLRPSFYLGCWRLSHGRFALAGAVVEVSLIRLRLRVE